MDGNCEDAFKNYMEKDLSNIPKVADALGIIQMKELIIKKQFLMKVDSL